MSIYTKRNKAGKLLGRKVTVGGHTSLHSVCLVLSLADRMNCLGLGAWKSYRAISEFASLVSTF